MLTPKDFTNMLFVVRTINSWENLSYFYYRIMLIYEYTFKAEEEEEVALLRRALSKYVQLVDVITENVKCM